MEGPWWTGLTEAERYIASSCHHCVVALADELHLARHFDRNNHPYFACHHLGG